MKVTRIYSGTDGETHFEDVDIPMEEKGTADLRSELVKATGIIFRETGTKYDLDFHNAPRRQYVITLEGSVDVTASDGTKKRFGPGDIMLAEDTTGKGHRSQAVGSRPRKCLFVTLD